jgi:hypothetical protein
MTNIGVLAGNSVTTRLAGRVAGSIAVACLMQVRRGFLLALLLCPFLGGCGDDGDSRQLTPPTPTATPRALQRYSLVGTANGQPAQGQLTFAVASGEPNLIRYDIISFVFGPFEGSGMAEFFTLDNSFTVHLSVRAPGGQDVELAGRASVLSTAPLAFGDFDVRGEGRTLTFSAARTEGMPAEGVPK